MADNTIKAFADPKQNRLHLSLSGKVDAKLLEQLYTDVRFAVADLKPGFEVINNISGCQLIYLTSLTIYKKIIDYLLTHKAGQIIRIVEKDNISCKQLVSFTEQINCYQPMYVASFEEAEQRLEEIVPRGGIRLKLRHLDIAYDSPVGSGKARINDLSVSGCAVTGASLLLPLDTEFEGHIGFPAHPPLIGQVQLKARVVRTTDDGFAGKFLGISDEFREQLYQRLLHEACQCSFKGG